ncbi:hypothetical protein D3C84_1036250 [compost metagenome]
MRVGHEHGVVADDDPGVGIALGRVGPGMLRDLAEGDLLFFQVGLAGEFLGLAHRVSPVGWFWDSPDSFKANEFADNECAECKPEISSCLMPSS